MTKQKAFEILGLEPTATNGQIKRKYANCARRAKFDTSYDIESATKAFDTIMGYGWGNFEPDEAYSQKGLNKKKIESFFYLHTRALVYSTVIVLILTTVVVSYFVTKVNSDFSLTVVGPSMITDQLAVQEYYEELLDVDQVLCASYTVGNFQDGEIDRAGTWWIYQDLAGGDSDLFITTAERAKFLSHEGAVRDLSPYFERLGIAKSDENIIWWYGEDGSSVAAAYNFGESDILSQGFSGDVPGCVCVPFRMEVSELSEIVIKDLINN